MTARNNTPSDIAADNPALAGAVEAIAKRLGREQVPAEPGEADDSPVFVKNGFIRVPVLDPAAKATSTLTLRRPKFGELRDLRLHLEAIEAEIGAAQRTAERKADDDEVRARRHQRRIAAINAALDGDDVTDEQLDTLIAERRDLLNAQSDMVAATHAAANEIRSLSDKLRLDWLGRVLDTVAIDEVPEDFEWPAWAANPDIIARFMTHWRSVPLGRG